MADSSYRQVLMLKRIPRYPSKITVTDLCHYLEEQGFPVSKRTVERDLNHLEPLFGLKCDDTSIPYGWSFDNSVLTTLPMIDFRSALTFSLSEKHLKDFLPPAIHKHLTPYFNAAKEQLNRLNNKKYGKWLNKITQLPRGMRLQPALINKDVINNVYDALLNNKKIEIVYKEKSKQLISPLGIVLKGPSIYLVCTFWNYAEVRQLALHRIKSTNVMDEPSNSIDGFCLEDYAYSGAFELQDSGKKVKVKLKFFNNTVNHLHETPLCDDQIIKDIDGTTSTVIATILDTQDLRWWLLGFGRNVEVLSPQSLRIDLIKEINCMKKLYE